MGNKTFNHFYGDKPKKDYRSRKLRHLEQRNLDIHGNAFIERRKYKDWSGFLKFYAFKCNLHGLVANYKQSHNQYLRCPICLHEKVERSKIERKIMEEKRKREKVST